MKPGALSELWGTSGFKLFQPHHGWQQRAALPQLLFSALPAAVGDDLIVRVLVEPAQRVFPCDFHPVARRRRADLPQQPLGPAAAEEGVLDVAHLRAREVQARPSVAVQVDI